MRALRNWVFTPPFILAFAGLLLVFDVLLRIAIVFGERFHSKVGCWLQILLIEALRICNVRFSIEKSPRIRDGVPYIIVSNHQSMYDIPVFAKVFYRNQPKYISKIELAKWIPSVSFHLRHGGHALIDRKHRESAVQVISDLGEAMKTRGYSAVIFAEGTRARRGELGAFKPAGTLTLLQRVPDAPVVPVCIDNSWRILARNLLPVPWGLRVRVWAGDPIERRPGEDPMEVFAEAERAIRTQMAIFRSEREAADAAGSTKPTTDTSGNGSASPSGHRSAADSPTDSSVTPTAPAPHP